MIGLLVASRDAKIVRRIRAVAVKNLWDLSIVPDVWDAMEMLHSHRAVDVILVDLSDGSVDAVRTIRIVRQAHPHLPFILIDHLEIAEGNQLIQKERECTFLSAPLVESQLEGAILSSAFSPHEHNGRAVKPPSSRPPSAPMPSVAEYKSLRSYLKNVREAAEKEAIVQTLEKTGWNRKAAARLLRVSYRSILYKIEEYHLSPPDCRVAGLRRSLDSEGTVSHGTKGSRLLRACVAGLATDQP